MHLYRRSVSSPQPKGGPKTLMACRYSPGRVAPVPVYNSMNEGLTLGSLRNSRVSFNGQAQTRRLSSQQMRQQTLVLVLPEQCLAAHKLNYQLSLGSSHTLPLLQGTAWLMLTFANAERECRHTQTLPSLLQQTLHFTMCWSPTHSTGLL